MKNRLILVTGGARSGKSLFAEQLVAETASRKFYLATCPVFDGELAERIARHKARREADDWRTIEEQLDLGSALRQAAASGGDGILIDCLTLWINNLFFQAAQQLFFHDDNHFPAAVIESVSHSFSLFSPHGISRKPPHLLDKAGPIG